MVARRDGGEGGEGWVGLRLGQVVGCYATVILMLTRETSRTDFRHVRQDRQDELPGFCSSERDIYGRRRRKRRRSRIEDKGR